MRPLSHVKIFVSNFRKNKLNSGYDILKKSRLKMKVNLLKKFGLAALIVLFISLTSTRTAAHCEVPCGIFADSVRVNLLLEHITTIEKAMTQINKLSEESKPNYNQIVRWVVTKEDHAEKIQDIVSQYFLHQRIKLTDQSDKEAYAKYQLQLEQLHKILVYSMKTKQTTDTGIIEKLRSSVHEFSATYFGEHKHDHGHKH